MQIEVLRAERKRWLSKEKTVKVEPLPYVESGVSYSGLERRRVFIGLNSIAVETDIFNGAATDCQSLLIGPNSVAFSNPSEFKPTLSRSVIARLIGHKVTFSIRQTP